jgi:signal transduction histidine kinase
MMIRRHILSLLLLFLSFGSSLAATDYQDDPKYHVLLDSMSHAFNSADSIRFYNAVGRLEDYLLEHGDLHAYYTQRCNEIVFLMNRNKIFEAYKMARKLSQELRERKLDKEMYMAYNMLGHIYRHCGNKEGAIGCFYEVLDRMEKAGYKESMPPIYLNLVGVLMEDNPEEAFQLIDKALEVAGEAAPQRVFSIEARRTVSYYSMGDTLKFLEGYKKYKQGEAEGLSSVYGRALEVYHLAIQGKIDEAVQLADKEMGEDKFSVMTTIYKNAGRWRDAFESLEHEYAAKDSVNSLVMTNSMTGIQDELRLYDTERKAARNKFIGLSAITLLLLLLIVALVYIVFSRRRHMAQLQNAYQRALESDRLKADFIQNMSHEVRTPLNIISGFTQVIADPNIDYSQEERRNMAQMIQKNTAIITNLVDEILELSKSEAEGHVTKKDQVNVNAFLRELKQEKEKQVALGVALRLDSVVGDSFTLQTDKTMLQRIMVLLLDNAAKYTEKGSIVMKARQEGERLELIVEDTGCGIPQSEAEHIFNRFVKLDNFKVGIGLGLPICRSLAEQLGGTVRLDTTYSQGARFVVSLPVLARE